MPDKATSDKVDNEETNETSPPPPTAESPEQAAGEEDKAADEEEEEEVINEEEDNEEDQESEEEEDKEKSDEESPTHVPKRGMFYQHDDRNYVEPDDDARGKRGPRVDNTGRSWGGKREKKWQHDMFNEDEQKPKEEVRSL